MSRPLRPTPPLALRCLAVLLPAVASAGLAACRTVDRAAADRTPPPEMLGAFGDDYGHRFTITPSRWLQHPAMRYEIVAWHPAGRYLIARAPSDSTGRPVRWARIDWVAMPPSQAPYTWAFCISAYDAPTRAVAESTREARPETPRTGCNGFPYSRMAPAAP